MAEAASQKPEKYVYAFEEGGREQKYLLGGKGANLAEMTNLGPARAARLHDHHRRVQGVHGRRRPAAGRPHGRSRRRARGARSRRWASSSATRVDPLLVSVRSGAPFSMPGMMDTVLNLGLNDESVQGPREADEQRALRVRLVPPLRADVRQDRARRPRRRVRGGAARPRRGEGLSRRHRALAPSDLAGLVETFKGIVQKEAGVDVPDRSHRAARATRSRPCSSRGTAGARATTAGWSASPTTSAPR